MNAPNQLTGIVEISGKEYMLDAKGGYRPAETIKAADKLQDEVVRKIVSYAVDLSAQVSRFKSHTFEDLGDWEAVLAQEYGTTVGGAKGNKTFMTFDGLQKVEVRVQDTITFGPELQIAKGLVDECLNEWSAESRPEIRTLVTNAFNTDQAGQINRAEIFMLLRLDIQDERWKRAMAAIRDAIRIVGSKTYVRIQTRERFDAEWRSVTIDLAKA